MLCGLQLQAEKTFGKKGQHLEQCVLGKGQYLENDLEKGNRFRRNPGRKLIFERKFGAESNGC